MSLETSGPDVADSRPPRKNRRRTVTVNRKKLARESALGDDETTIGERKWARLNRPKKRSDCEGSWRPCPWVACRYHLYLEVNGKGSIQFNHPDLEVWELMNTCALDVADEGDITLERAGEIFNLTRERIRQVEVQALDKVRQSQFGKDVARSLGIEE